MKTTTKHLISLLALAGFAGCTPTAHPPTEGGATALNEPAKIATDMPSFGGGPPSRESVGREPQPDVKILVHLNVYRIAVPVRTVSRNEAFWKHVDENAVGITEAGVLLKNGFRVGLATRDDWEYFKGVFADQTVVTQTTGASGLMPSAIEIPMKEGLLSQTIMYIHPEYGLTGHRYDRCDNLMSIQFAAHPRLIGTVKLGLTPTVRSQREEIQYSVRNEERVFEFKKPECLYDMKLRAEVPLNGFLVVAPSEDASDETSVGHQFLIQDLPGEQYESLLVISPQPFVFAKTTAAGPATKPAAALP